MTSYVLRKCGNCGSWTTEELYDKETSFCSTCFDEYCSICSVCHEHTFTSYGEEVNGAFYCQRCFDEHFRECDYCNRVLERSEIRIVDGHRQTCEPCYRERFFECIRCGQATHRNYCYQGQYQDELYCQSCYDIIDQRPIRFHEYVPVLDYLGSKSDKTLYYGVELEVESKRWDHREMGYVASVINATKVFYCKEDGSLDNGFEIVSHPFTWDWFIKTGKDLYKEMFTFLKGNGYTSYLPGSCGLHVHMSKAAFSTLHIFKFMKLIYEPENLDFIVAISQRGDVHRMCRYANILDEDKSSLIRRAKAKTFYSRYEAVNLKPSNTSEVRIFRGTLKAESFYKSLEFCEALYHYTKNEKIEEVTWNNFCKFVIHNHDHYSNLYNFMVKKNILIVSP